MSNDLTQMWIRFDQGESEAVLRANAEGLRNMADHLIALAEEGRPGSHRHFDEGSPLDDGSGPFVVTLALAPWDEPSNEPIQSDLPSAGR